MLTKTKLLLIASTVFLASTGLSNASDKKDFPGSTCQVEYDYQYFSGNHGDSLWGYYGGAYTNSASDDGAGGNYDHVNCPVLRDNTINTNGANVKVRVYNSGLGRGMWCELFSASKFTGTSAGQEFPNPEEIVHVDAGPGLSELDLTALTSSPGGHYSLHCEVPPGSFIYSYELKEAGTAGSDN